ncbi:MAG TPA: hypothetical protein VGP31_20000 [Planosporangium sp.]|nr:hypothetical protein [Planosporangium sp.]
MAAGVLVTATGLVPALLGCAGIYLLATTLPVLLPEWREMDTGRFGCSHRKAPSFSKPHR